MNKAKIWRRRIFIFILDFLLAGFDFVSDIIVVYGYYTNCYNFWTACGVTFIVLPSISLLAEQYWKHRKLTLKTFVAVIFITPTTMFRALKCAWDPENNKYKDEFWELRIHEVSYESLMQFNLQTHVIIHKGLPKKNSTLQNVILVGSLISSIISMWYGTNYQWLHSQYEEDPTPGHRLKLMALTFPDLTFRIGFCTILFAAIHREGLALFTFYGLCYPIIMYFRKDPGIQVTSDILPAFNPIFHQNKDQDKKASADTLKKIRIDMKIFYNFLIFLILSLMVLLYYVTDIDTHCNEEKTFCFFHFATEERMNNSLSSKCHECKQDGFWADPVCKPLKLTEDVAFKIIHPIMLFLLIISSIEIIQYKCYGTTWLDWLLKDCRSCEQLDNDTEVQPDIKTVCFQNY